MGSGPSREEQIKKAISKLPSPTLIFPGYYHMEARFLENKDKLLSNWNLCSDIITERFEISYVSTILNFLSDFLKEKYSDESDKQDMNIEKRVINQLNTFISSEIREIEKAFILLRSSCLTDAERGTYNINGIAGCNKIINLFSDQESYLFQHPLVTAPILMNLAPLYVALVLLYYTETKSPEVRDDLYGKFIAFEKMVNNHMNRATAERLRHIRGEICPADNGSFYVYYDHVFPKKLELLSEWYPGESLSFRYKLSGADMDEIIGHYKKTVEEEYNSYFEKSVLIVAEAAFKLEALRKLYIFE